MEKIAITAMGMISSVGHDVRTSCASIRAAMNRFRKLNYFFDFDEEELENIGITGAPIYGFSEGYFPLGFWTRTAIACIQDMIQGGKVPNVSDQAFWSKTALIVATPCFEYGRFSVYDAVFEENKTNWLETVIQQLELPIQNKSLFIIYEGNVGGLTAIKKANELLQEEQWNQVIVLGVDSWLDTMSLEWLSQHKRLLLESKPKEGMIPGEAGACILLETKVNAEQRKVLPLAQIGLPSFAQENNHFFTEEKNQGNALGNSIQNTLNNLNQESPFQGDIIADTNGELWRSYETSMALVHAHAFVKQEHEIIEFSDSIGDVGASSVIVSICIAIHSFLRNYSKTNTTLILSSSEQGKVGSVCVFENKTK